jgi:hypothetical protein
MSILFYVTLTNIDAGWLLTPHLLDWVLIIVACVGLNDAVSRAQLKGANRSVSLTPAHLPEQGLYAIHTFRG